MRHLPLRVGFVALVLLLLHLLAAPYASAQARGTPSLVLESVLDGEFSDIAFVRELPSGSVLVYDRVERQLYAVRAGSREVVPIGTDGAGPISYGNITALVSLGGDSTLIVDETNRRWALSVGEDIRSVLPPDHASLRWGISAFGASFGRRLLVGKRVQRLPDVNEVEMRFVDLVSGSNSIVAHLATVPIRREVTSRNPDGSPAVFRAMPELLSAPEQALQFSDGWVAVVRLRPYRVSWRRPDGEWIHGESWVPSAVPVTEEEKNAFARRISRSSGRDWNPASTTIWATEVAPIADADALIALPDGRVLVRRSFTARVSVPTYDIVDRTGNLAGQIALPPGHKIVGAGRRVIYVAAENPDGLQRVQRHVLAF